MLQMAGAARPDRLERMTNLVLVLLETSRPLSLREISSKVVGYPEGKEASRQAFERDKRALRKLGIPISVEPLQSDEQLGYRIRQEDYYLPELGLDPAEEQALGFAVAAVQLGGAAGRDAVAKLASMSEVPEPALADRRPSLAAGARPVARGRARPCSRRLQLPRPAPGGGAVRAHLQAHRLVPRRARPFGARRRLRTFRVDRLDDAPVRKEAATFELPAGFDLRTAVRFLPWQVRPRPANQPGDETDGAELVPVDVQLLVDARLARSVVATIGAGSVERWEPSGAVRLKITAPERPRFVDWVVGLGDTAEVLTPDEVRADVVQRLLAMASKAPRAKGDGRAMPPAPAMSDGVSSKGGPRAGVDDSPLVRARPAWRRGRTARGCHNAPADPSAAGDRERPAEPASRHLGVPGPRRARPVCRSWQGAFP